MGSALHTMLGSHPEIALFLALCIGHAIGQIRFGPVQLGGICGTLIAALLIGQVGVEVDASVKNLFFMLFIFFVRSLILTDVNRNGVFFHKCLVLQIFVAFK